MVVEQAARLALGVIVATPGALDSWSGQGSRGATPPTACGRRLGRTQRRGLAGQRAGGQGRRPGAVGVPGGGCGAGVDHHRVGSIGLDGTEAGGVLINDTPSRSESGRLPTRSDNPNDSRPPTTLSAPYRSGQRSGGLTLQVEVLYNTRRRSTD